MTSLETHFLESGSKRDFGERYLSYLSELMKRIDVEVVERIIDVLIEAGERGNTIFVIGNGGSAAIASHFANDLSIGTRGPEARPFKVISLVDNSAILTAIANDEKYTSIFSRQLDGVLRGNDVVVGFSVSGNSANIVEALRYAKDNQAITIGCTGFDGGEVRGVVDLNLHVPTHRGEYGPVEDIFTPLGHLIYSYLRRKRLGRL